MEWMVWFNSAVGWGGRGLSAVAEASAALRHCLERTARYPGRVWGRGHSVSPMMHIKSAWSTGFFSRLEQREDSLEPSSGMWDGMPTPPILHLRPSALDIHISNHQFSGNTHVQWNCWWWHSAGRRVSPPHADSDGRSEGLGGIAFCKGFNVKFHGLARKKPTLRVS